MSKVKNNDIEILISKIDNELINEWDCIENHTKSNYFDFYTAIEQLLGLLKSNSLLKYYERKLIEYHHALKDLFHGRQYETKSSIDDFVKFMEQNQYRDIDELFYRIPIDMITGYDYGYFENYAKKLKKQVDNLGLIQNVNSFRPKFNTEAYDYEGIFKQLKEYFKPEIEFHNFIFGKEMKSMIDFTGNQKQLAGIFHRIQNEIKWVEFGTWEQTYCFIKDNFTINGVNINTKQILNCFKKPGELLKSRLIDFET
ncbi:MAG: hypothetical protein JXA77_01210 [Bacteroidales bacterium]|nr:hypothetical protein [Bacteroidales bacterium]